MKKEDCIFCKIAAGEIPSKTLYEDEQFRVILDLAPATKGHALVIPKEHYANLYEIPQETAAGVMKLAKTMAEKMTEKLGAVGFNLLQNNGEAAGQSVMHFHMHLIPRYHGDGQQLFHEQPTASQDELEEIKRQITE
ncbi:MAG: HIT family protein [Lachnospiraceae bacterium]|nr:HIT family protein [Lachnospiraceae bacterium]